MFYFFFANRFVFNLDNMSRFYPNKTRKKKSTDIKTELNMLIDRIFHIEKLEVKIKTDKNGRRKKEIEC